jgi:uroporphyrinogen III methyltransferase/synthase
MNMSDSGDAGIGKVYIVGAGPGDPGLFTLRAKEVLARADVIVYDDLVNDALLQHAPRAETIYVGKRPGQHALTQDDINRLLVEQARRVGSVARLKGGDPFVFGRGGEEAEALAGARVPFEIVPGVTAGIAASAYAGIPVTHRGVASSVTFMSGRAMDDASEFPFADLPRSGTLVFYMGVKASGLIAERLAESGRAPSTPVAIVENGTHSAQRTVIGALESLGTLCEDEGIQSPALVIVGDVVGLRTALAWFEERPLHGTRIAVTRARKRPSELVSRLKELGADIFEFPTVEARREGAAARDYDLASFDWIVLASMNAVEALFDYLNARGRDARVLHGARLCAIGAKTVAELAERYLKADVAPDTFESAGILAMLESEGGPLNGKRFLLPRADIVRRSLQEGLKARGAEVTALDLFYPEVPAGSEALVDRLINFAPDFVTFTSASAARNFHAILGRDKAEALSRNSVFAAIGPGAAGPTIEVGLEAPIMPATPTLDKLVDALVNSRQKNK